MTGEVKAKYRVVPGAEVRGGRVAVAEQDPSVRPAAVISSRPIAALPGRSSTVAVNVG
jgi:hypothetical protein